jgi:phenylacetate-CoA ligase
MSAYAGLYRHLIYPAYHRLIGHGALAAIEEIAAHESLDRTAMRALEDDKRVALVAHAAATVPYWTRTLEALGIRPEDTRDPRVFSRLPVTSKAVIREHLDDLVSTDLENNRLDSNSTSGSTGQPLRFFTDLRSKAYRKASTVRLRRWVGIEQGQTVAHIWGSPIDQARAEAWRGRLHGLITREIFLSAYELTDDDMARYAGILAKRRAELVVGYPSVMAAFGRFCAERGLAFPALKSVIVSAETLYPDQRKIIEEALNAPVFNRYGCREVGDIAQERPGSGGLVVNSDRVYVEIVAPDGNPCGRGETGEILVTDLDNYGMPLIRYRIGDSASWSSAESGPFPVLAAVDGRSLDVVSTPDGRRIGGTFWTIVLREKPGMDQFQVIQREPGGVTVRYVKAPDALPDFDWMKERIHAQCGPDFQVRFEEVQAIPPGAGGKHRIVISELGEGGHGA